MAILAECPICKQKQANKNKICRCGEDLDKAKRSGRVRYWIDYRIVDKQRREPVGFSLSDAQAAMGKRKGQKRENRIFDMLPESKITFRELTDWYVALGSVKKLKTSDRIEGSFKKFNKVFGERPVNSIRLEDLENYQIVRETEGKAPATIDMEIKLVQTAVTKAFDNDKIDGKALKAFRKLKRKLVKGSNARSRTLSFEEYKSLLIAAPSHLRNFLVVGFNTGMRLGEIRTLKWANVDLEGGFFRLTADMTKEGKAKIVPINHHVRALLGDIHKSPDHDFVFTYRGREIVERGGILRSFGTACKNAKIPCRRSTENGITFHDIRRTVKTNMLKAGVSKEYRDIIFGHSLQGMDAYYLKPDESSIMKAMEKFTDWLDEQLLDESQKVDYSVD